MSRLTLVTTGSDAVIQQITHQLLKLVDVVDVEDVTREEHFERELLLVKVKAPRDPGRLALWSAMSARRRARALGCAGQLHD